jgi:endogenous inhibitor of DNA gyrase (YacG/DUF329 family)
MAGPAGPGGDKLAPLRPSRACPVCGKPSVRATYRFGSKRCADIDLDRRLSRACSIPAVELDTSGPVSYKPVAFLAERRFSGPIRLKPR